MTMSAHTWHINARRLEIKKLHIISFDNPFPPSYGGAIDVYYRVKALAEQGVNIDLHCFYKDTLRPSGPLEQLCEHVYFYPRKTTLCQQFHLRPYGVVSRTHPDLLPRLLADDAPILFEGLTSCGLMAHPALRQRRKFFRECNVEHDYYHALARASHSWKREIFFHIEAERLRLFERCLRHADGIFALAHQDEAYFRQQYRTPTYYIPGFHGHQHVETPVPSDSPYILYHGNLSVSENSLAALYIAEHLADKIPARLVIAGYNPPEALKRAVARHANMELIESPDEDTMNRLLRDAAVHLLITFQATGIKLKLLNVLYAGGQVVVNPPMIVGTELDALCHVGHDDEALAALCMQYIRQALSPEEKAQRQDALNRTYNDAVSAQQIVKIIYR